MSDFARLARLLFPHVETTPAQLMEQQYPPRNLPEGALVTRFAPSPTGFMHIGNVYTANVAERAAHSSGGVLILRIEDTDKKREVENGVPLIIRSLRDFGIHFDEGPLLSGGEAGAYGPYTQSERKPLYHAFCKDLVERGHAYPCFCTAEELDALRQRQEAAGQTPGYWGEHALWRDASIDAVEEKLGAGIPYVMRLRSPGKPGGRVKFKDVIRGDIEMEENFADVVLLKSDGIPTYHFAHVVDDTLMRVNQIIRGEEWIASAPIHLQMFWLCGLKAPKYAHVSPMMKEEDDSKRKLSKRKDPEAAATFFVDEGYPAGAVIEYLLSIANSNYEDWQKQNKEAGYRDFPFTLKKMSASGALFDLIKLQSVSSAFISRLSATEVYAQATAWAGQQDAALHTQFTQNPDYATAIFAIDRDIPKPRKDIAKWRDVADYVSYFYNETFRMDAGQPEAEPALRKAVLEAYAAVYEVNDDKDTWFQKIKDLCEPLGFCPDVKAYKAAPEQYKGSVSDLTAILRVALTGRKNTPDLHSIMQLLGHDTVLARLKAGAL